MSETPRPAEPAAPAKPAPNTGGAPAAPADATPASPPSELTPEEQMEKFAEELKETDWGHQPC